MSDEQPQVPIRRLREEISGLDRAILDAVNARLELVAELKRYKETHGIPFVDPDRERQLVEDLVAANRGPLSDEGLRDLFSKLLELMKREVSRDGRSG